MMPIDLAIGGQFTKDPHHDKQHGLGAKTYDYTSAKEISYKVVKSCYLICAQKYTFHFRASKGCNEHPTYKKSFFLFAIDNYSNASFD